MLSDVQLRVVSTESVLPHEIADPTRERRIEAKIRQEGVLRDPLLVGKIPDVDGYVLLDGTNRRRALESLGAQGVLVQVIDYSNPHAVELRTWCHAASVPLDTLIEQSGAISGLETTPLSPLAAPDALRSTETLAVLLDRGRHVAFTRAGTTQTPRVQQLRELVDLYEDHMVRVDCEPENVEERAGTVTGPAGEHATLVAFPPFTRAQVVALAMQKALIPAGITRHIILGGRALRVNLELPVLLAREGLDHANRALERHLASLHPRMYSEPTVLFDS